MADDACACACSEEKGHVPSPERQAALQRGLRLEYLTVGWNVVEGSVAVLAALAAGSVALLGFGIDSFVEMTSGLILIWRLRAERRATCAHDLERLDQVAHKLVACSLFLLAGYVAFEAAKSLITHEHPQPTLIGVVITVLSLGMMAWLARAKRQTARALGSRALEADTFQTTACMWLSVITLVGIGLNALTGWWWADPLAALAMCPFVISEARQAWRGEDCGCAQPAELR